MTLRPDVRRALRGAGVSEDAADRLAGEILKLNNPDIGDVRLEVQRVASNNPQFVDDVGTAARAALNVLLDAERNKRRRWQSLQEETDEELEEFGLGPGALPERDEE